MIKLLVVAFVAERITAGFPSLARFLLVFLSALAADNLRARGSSESPLFLEDIFIGVLASAGAGLFSWWVDARLSLYTGRHAGAAVPAVLFAVLSGYFFSRRRYL